MFLHTKMGIYGISRLLQKNLLKMRNRKNVVWEPAAHQQIKYTGGAYDVCGKCVSAEKAIPNDEGIKLSERGETWCVSS